MDGMAVVVSPLLSLMKDQVDALNECGVPAARLDSSQTPGERRSIFQAVRSGRIALLYVSPERLVSDGFLDLLGSVCLSFIAVDESHCVSMWGHDFRPEYRQLRVLKERFRGVGVHAFTATATATVRRDIAEQLALVEPEFLVGSFFRPNLRYRVQARGRLIDQVSKVVQRYPRESGIIYCIRRADVDDLAASLSAKGYSVAPYHAGMEGDQRRLNQERFINDEVQIIVATVAFGMGIDKPDVRYVIHAAAPKSLEHYQQETGRAGRDGLAAECLLLHGGKDFSTWRYLINQSEAEPEVKAAALQKISDVDGYCGGRDVPTPLSTVPLRAAARPRQLPGLRHLSQRSRSHGRRADRGAEDPIVRRAAARIL